VFIDSIVYGAGCVACKESEVSILYQRDDGTITNHNLDLGRVRNTICVMCGVIKLGMTTLASIKYNAILRITP
jgi:hypothetical protein